MFVKLENLQSKIEEELVSLKDNLATIHTYSAKFSNLDELKYETEIKRNQLMTDQQDLSEKKLQLQTQVNQLQFEYDELQVNYNFTVLKKSFKLTIQYR